jgi:two-component system NtrC family sensor kinase
VLDILTTQHRNIRAQQDHKPFELDELIWDLRTLSTTLLDKYHIRLETDLPRLPSFRISRNHLLQALLNLVKNGQESVAQRLATQCSADRGGSEGVITIRATVVAPTDYEHTQVRIEVSDNGIGMDRETRERSMQMGFTTKASGSGVGLHSVAIYAQLMQGSLQIESRGPNQGATVSLTISTSEGRG